LVGQWNNYTEFNRLERLGLTMYGQMTAGSWIYIGSQGIVQGTFETFAAAGRKHFRSEEHTSELQSRFDLVCRLLLEKKNYVHSGAIAELSLLGMIIDVTKIRRKAHVLSFRTIEVFDE